MGHLLLSGQLNLMGSLKLAATAGGKVKVGGAEVLVEVGLNGASQGNGIPVILPPPPATPLDKEPEVRIIKSFNPGVTVKVGNSDLPVVVMGITVQGSNKTWPGMVLPSIQNKSVKINQVDINVVDDKGITLPNSGTVNFKVSGQ